MKKSIFNWVLLSILLFFLITIFFLYDQKEKKFLYSKEIIKCTDLNYEETQMNSKNKFGSFDLELKILNERKWKKTLINNQIDNLENKSFTYDPDYINAEIIVKNKHGLNCKLKAEIKPHGDLGDHFVDFRQGANIIYDLPSLKVKLSNGNINGIVEFRLFKPETRNHSNEIFATTFLEELGMLAPRTSLVNVLYNNEINEFIFQEKINKEFLENNKLLEGPIYSGDERFVFKYNEDLETSVESGVSKHKLTDRKWASINSVNSNVASIALELLNTVNHFYYSDINQVMFVDYFTSQLEGKFSSFFSNLPKFDAISFAIGSTHNLSRDDRRLYYDVVKKVFVPIYYDGMVLIFNNENQFIKNSSRFDMSKNSWVNHANNNKILNSAIIGSTSVLKDVQGIDLNSLNKKLVERGFVIPSSELNKTIKTINNNLEILNKIPKSRIIISKNKNQHTLKNDKALNKNINAKYLFKNIDNKYYTCGLKLDNCNNLNLDNNQIPLVLEQKFKNKDEHDIIYLGNIENFKNINHSEIDINNNLREIKFINNTFIKIYGDIDIKVNNALKKIEIIKNNINGKVLITDGELDNWTIDFMDNSTKNYFFDRRDINGLSGCINIYDVIIKNLKLTINNAVCEDAINLVRTTGSILNVEISNSISDAMDLDFSDLELKTIKIENAGNDCIDLSYGSYNLHDINLSLCGDKGLSVGEASNLVLDKIFIDKSNIGIATKDSSFAKFNNVKMDTLNTCIASYNKKQEFHGGFIIIENISCNKYYRFKDLDSFSKIVINNLI